MKRPFLTVLLILSFFVVPAFGGDDDLVARIGDRKILLSDFNRWVRFGSEESVTSLEQDPKHRDSLLRQIVTSIVIAEQARKEGFDKRPDIQENMELLINNFLTLEYLDKAVAQKVEVKEKDLKRFYKENKQKFQVPEKVRARHILIRVDRTASDDELKKALDRAESVLKKVRAGEDFSQLASEFSEDAGSGKKGGDLGFFPRDMMAPEFEKAAFALKPGQVSEIVHTSFGFHIIKVEEKMEPSIQPFEDVKDQLRRNVAVEMKREAVDAYVDKVTREAGVEFFVEPLLGSKKDPHMR